jgi:hypothetical protein
LSRSLAAELARSHGVLPLDYMLGIMRDPSADNKRRDAMAMAAAPYLHPRLTAIDAKLSPANAELSSERRSLTLEFILPSPKHAPDDQE